MDGYYKPVGDGEMVEGRDGWRRIENTGRTREEAKGMTGQ
jgi:hypothetical protein